MDELKFENQDNFELRLMQDELEYLQLKGDFFEVQTEVWGTLINKEELNHREIMKEEQELIDQFNKREIEKEKLIDHLKALKNQAKVNASKGALKKGRKKETMFIRIDGFFNCPECDYKAKTKQHLKRHLNGFHLKLKPFKCTECDEGLFYFFI